MSSPIAQTFLVYQPETGIDGVFLTRIDVYFKSVSKKFGVTMEIRTVDNGFPTATMVPRARSHLRSSWVNANEIAPNKATSFYFNDLVFLQSNVQYAFVIIPDGGNDEYQIWTASNKSDVQTPKDILTGAPIFFKPEIGNMFLSSNDLVYTPVITESIKYDLYVANFTSSTANVFFRPALVDFIKVNNTVGNFTRGEAVYVSNSKYTYAQTTSNSTTVKVPNSSIADLAVNNYIYITTSDFKSVNFVKVTNNTVNSTTIKVNANINFTNSTCTFGRIRGDGSLFGQVKTKLRFSPLEEEELVISSAAANSSINFANATSQFIFGLTSNSIANVSAVANKQYDTLTPKINFISPAQTAISFAYKGYGNNGIQDTDYITAQDGLPNEFLDNERILYSRSNALANNTIGSNPTLLIKAQMNTSNNLTAPFIDNLGTAAILTYNAPTSQTQLTGYHLNLTGTSGKFLIGETITQGSVGAIVDGANNSYLRVNVANGVFTNTTITGGTSGATANVTVATYFDETLENGYYAASRYISKNVILAEQQDAEDLLCYLTLYRPVGTQFNVYAKFLNGSDTDSFSSKDWSYMPEMSVSSALFSSAVNRDDLIEAQFGLPSSIMIDPNSGVSNTSLANVTVLNSAYYTANTYVYLRDNDSGSFNVRKVSAVANSSTITLSTKPSFSSSNVTVGYIPNLQSQSGAFLYANNNNIVRYVTSTDVVYDSYKTFAVKIVPVSNNSILVPIMKNMRSLALQI